MRFLTAFLISILLSACAGTPPGQGGQAGVSKTSKQFFACYDESKRPWLISVVASKDPSGAKYESLIPDYIGGTLADQARARGYLTGLRQKKYASAEEMAGVHYNACMAAVAAEKFEPTRSIGCYKEQRIIFELTALREVHEASLADATAHLVKANPSADGSTEAAIKRLARDTYTIMKPGQEYEFSSAQFQVCMIANS